MPSPKREVLSAYLEWWVRMGEDEDRAEVEVEEAGETA